MPTNPTPNLKFVRSADRTYITVTDLTGAYDADDNEGGYGGPNVAAGDYTAFNISVTLPDTDTLLPGGTPVVINAYSSLPSQSDGTFVITSEALLGTANTVIPDGVYGFSLSAPWVDGLDTGTTTASFNKAFYEIAQCCIDNLVVKFRGCGCSGTSKKTQSLAKAIIYLYALSPKVVAEVIEPSPVEACNNWTEAAAMILELQDICDNENCGGCNGCN